VDILAAAFDLVGAARAITPDEPIIGIRKSGFAAIAIQNIEGNNASSLPLQAFWQWQFLGGIVWFIGQSPTPNRSTTTTAFNRAIPEAPPNQTASFIQVDEPKPPPVLPAVPLPKDTTIIQNRLIELGYLKAPADGLWGPRSKQALLAFKISNGLTADDKFDPSVSARIVSANNVRGPLSNNRPPAPGGR
jgi:hypothetical protein